MGGCAEGSAKPCPEVASCPAGMNEERYENEDGCLMVKCLKIPSSTPLPTPGCSYFAGPSASNYGYTCQDWHGPLDEAKIRCDEDSTCYYLHDWGNDGKNWRGCSAITRKSNGKAASMIKSCPRTPSPTPSPSPSRSPMPSPTPTPSPTLSPTPTPGPTPSPTPTQSPSLL